MRTLLTLFGGLSIVGAVMDGALAALLGLLVMTGRADQGASVDSFLSDHWPALLSLAGAASRHGFEPAVLWMLAIPALVFFPLRIILGLTIGAAALAAAAKGGPRR